MRNVFSLGRAAGARRRSALLSLPAALVLCAFAGFAAPALAGTATTRPLVSSFDGGETPQGGFGSLIRGIGVDAANGHVYVSDTSDGVVDVFESSGKYLFQLDGSSTPRGSLSPYGVAVDNSGGPAHGNVYVADNFNSLVDVFNSAGEYLYQIDGSDNPQGRLIGIFPNNLAVNSSGDLLIATGVGGSRSEPRYLYEYATKANSAEYLSSVPVAGDTAGFALNAAGDIFLSDGGLNVEELDPAGEPLGDFASNRAAPPLAIDPASGDLLVDQHDILEYSPSGSVVRRFAGTVESSEAMAVDGASGDTLQVDAGLGRVDVYGPPSSVTVPDLTIEQPTPGYFSAQLTGTIDPQGAPASYRFEYKLHSATSWSATEPQSAGSGGSAAPIAVELPGLIQNSAYDVRLLGIATETGAIVSSAVKTFATSTAPPPVIEPVAAITAHGAAFSGSVNPQGVAAGWRFEYSADGVNWTSVPALDESAGSGSSNVPVTVSPATLDPNTTYRVRLVATYLGGAGGSVTSGEVGFTTSATAPQASTREAFPVAATTATLRGVIDPEHSATTYWFEYGPADCASNPCASVPATRDASAGATLGPKAFADQIEGLQPETAYHFRLLAKNQVGTVAGADLSFTTTSAATAEWPTRGIELINSPEKANQPVIFAGRYFPGGFGDSYATWATLTGTASSTSGAVSLLMASRTSSGWQSENFIPTSVYEGLLEAIVPSYLLPVARGRMEITALGYLPASGERLVGLADAGPGDGYGIDGYFHAYARIDRQGDFKIIFSVLPGEGGGDVLHGAAATDDLKRLFIVTSHPYVSAQAPKTYEIYEVSSGVPTLVSKLPDGTLPACGAGFAEDNGSGGNDGGSLSNDPGRDQLVFFISQGDDCSGPSNLYVRDVEAGTTQLISGPPLAGDPEPNQSVQLLKLSRDGRSALFITYASLLAGDDADGDSEDADIYQWTDGQGLRCLTCSAPRAEVSGAIASEDLSHVYFTSGNQLVAGHGAQQPASYDNLYVYHAGEIDYVSPYSPDNDSRLHADSVAIVPDGHVIFFTSLAPGMTPDDPGTCGGGPCVQAYRYDADDHGLECVSCRPAGAPSGPSFTTSTGDRIFGGASADGNTFVFDSSYALLPEDINGTDDIYEWRDGRLRLITDGLAQVPAGPGEPGLVGITPDGANVFFTLGAHLTGYEIDQTSQLYDARVGGGFPPPPEPPAPCGEDACQGPLAPPPALTAPGSATFEGPANQAPAATSPRSSKPSGSKHKSPSKKARRKPGRRHKPKPGVKTKPGAKNAHSGGRQRQRSRHSRAANHHRGGAK